MSHEVFTPEALEVIAAVKRAQGLCPWEVAIALRQLGGGRRASYRACKVPPTRRWRIIVTMAVLGAKDPHRAASKFILFMPVSIVGICGFGVLPYGSLLINRMTSHHLAQGLLGIGVVLAGCAVMSWATRWFIKTMA